MSIRCKIGNNNELAFWNSTWLGTRPFCRLFHEAFENCANPSTKVVEMGEWIQRKWCWNFGRILDLNNLVADSQASKLMEMITNIQPSLDNIDRFIWWKTKLDFSVQSSFIVLFSILEYNIGSNLETLVLQKLNKVWNPKIPSNTQVFCWRLSQNSLPTRSQLNFQGVLANNQKLKCVFRDSSIEDDIHPFPVATVVWSKVHN